MKRLIRIFLQYYLFWILYFTLFKLILCLYNFQSIKELALADLWGIFRHGIIMDLSVAGYFSMIPGLILCIGGLFASRYCAIWLKYYTLLMLTALTFLGLSDMGLYSAWGGRLDAQFLMYLQTPMGIWASLSWWQLLLFP
ncbi:MAG: hypothetical protein ACK5L5_07590, partial [Bacteroidales bacterium]